MIKQLIHYLWKNKLWWLAPPLFVFLIFGILILVSTTVPISPFIYALF